MRRAGGAAGIGARRAAAIVAGLMAVAVAPGAGAAPPGVVVDHLPAATGRYVGSPSIARLPDGRLLATHDHFGPGTSEWTSAVTAVFSSADDGATWERVATIDGAFWSNLFCHAGAVWLLGPTHHHGPLVIRRSDDGGRTWTLPDGPTTGLLAEGEWHTAPMPVLEHDGRIWRGVEDASGGREWGKRYAPVVISAPLDADLLDRASWRFTPPVPRDPAWLGGRFVGWLEGNLVADADGNLLDILRVEAGPLAPGERERAAIVRVTADGTAAAFDAAHGFIDFPGGAKKFAIRRDPAPGRPVWWSLASACPPSLAGTGKPAAVRTTLVLLRSENLRDWERRTILLHHPDVARHGFQYVDWIVDGDDILAVSRTAFDDDHGGARSAHDANYLTFHRVARFRDLGAADSVVDPATLGW
ncbi:MAG: sialidase family protein [Planctomycetaceae bacterium]